MISNGYSLTFVINTIFAIFNSIGISKISSNHVFSPIPKQFYYRAKPDIMKN